MKYLLLLFLTFISVLYPERVIVNKEYTIGDIESKRDGEIICLDLAKKEALQRSKTYINSESLIKNMQLSEDNLKAFASGIIKNTKIISKEFNYPLWKMKVSVEVDVSNFEKELEEYKRRQSRNVSKNRESLSNNKIKNYTLVFDAVPNDRKKKSKLLEILNLGADSVLVEGNLSYLVYTNKDLDIFINDIGDRIENEVYEEDFSYIRCSRTGISDKGNFYKDYYYRITSNTLKYLFWSFLGGELGTLFYYLMVVITFCGICFLGYIIIGVLLT